MSTTSRLIDSASVKGIMNKRGLVKTDQIGKRVQLTIQGDGNTLDVKNADGEYVQSVVEPGTVLQKRIFNCKANSELAMKNERNRQYLIDAIAAEKAGDAEKAHTLFSQYLNAVQVSFGVLLPSPVAGKLANNIEVSGIIQRIDTENGSLITIDPSTISVLAPEAVGTTTFSLDEFMPAEKESVATAVATEA